MRDQAFIIMAYQGRYSSSIGPIVELAVRRAYGLETQVASRVEPFGPGQIFCDHICVPIKVSRVCVADYTYESTNVGLEAGIAFMAGKPVIQVIQPEWRREHLDDLGRKHVLTLVPADVAGRPVLPYRDAEELAARLGSAEQCWARFSSRQLRGMEDTAEGAAALREKRRPEFKNK